MAPSSTRWIWSDFQDTQEVAASTEECCRLSPRKRTRERWASASRRSSAPWRLEVSPLSSTTNTALRRRFCSRKAGFSKKALKVVAGRPSLRSVSAAELVGAHPNTGTPVASIWRQISAKTVVLPTPGVPKREDLVAGFKDVEGRLALFGGKARRKLRLLGIYCGFHALSCASTATQPLRLPLAAWAQRLPRRLSGAWA